MIYKKKPILGFDIGSHSIKVVQIKASRPARALGYGSVDLPPHALSEGLVVDAEGLAKTVGQLLTHPAAGRLSARRAAVSIPVSKVFVRTLQLPKMEKKDLQQAINLQVELYVPIPVSDLYIDYEIIPDSGLTEAAETQVLMVAAPKSIVDSYMRMFEFLNLEVDSIEMNLAALTRSLISYGISQQTVLVVDFGSQSSDLAIHDHVIRLTSTIGVGGDQMTAAIAKSLEIGPLQAEELKVKSGLAAGPMQAKLATALKTPLTNVVSEIRKTIKYYNERGGTKRPVQSIIISGGSAAMPGLADFLFGELKLPVIIGDPLKTVSFGNLAVEPTAATKYATAIGLAMRELSHD